jgi:hypothetical protein
MICGCYSSFEELLPSEKPPIHVLLELKHEKDIENSLKSAPATPNVSKLSFGTNCSHSQSRDTIPLMRLHQLCF